MLSHFLIMQIQDHSVIDAFDVLRVTWSGPSTRLGVKRIPDCQASTFCSGMRSHLQGFHHNSTANILVPLSIAFERPPFVVLSFS